MLLVNFVKNLKIVVLLIISRTVTISLVSSMVLVLLVQLPSMIVLLCVILLSKLMILLSTLSVIGLLICGNGKS